MSARRARRAAGSAHANKGLTARAWWRRPLVYVGALAVLAVLAVGLALRSNSSTAPPASGEAVVPCSGTEMLSYHIHAHLEIDIRGARQVVPANTGIHTTCLYWLHTHDDTGLIHIEAPVSAVYTLGQFFTVWGQPLSRDQVLGEHVGPAEAVHVFVNGQPYEGDPRTIPLEAHEQIVVQLGPPYPSPQSFVFPPGS